MEILSDGFLEQYADAERTGGFLLYILAVRVSCSAALFCSGRREGCAVLRRGLCCCGQASSEGCS